MITRINAKTGREELWLQPDELLAREQRMLNFKDLY